MLQESWQVQNKFPIFAEIKWSKPYFSLEFCQVSHLQDLKNPKNVEKKFNFKKVRKLDSLKYW